MPDAAGKVLAHEMHQQAVSRLVGIPGENEVFTHQKIMYAAVLLLSLTTTLSVAQQAQGGGNVAAPKSNVHVLTNAELDKLLAHPETLVLVDVRRPDEVSSIGGFPVYLSIQIKDLEKSLAWIPKERTVVLVSNHAGRASQGAEILANKGFKVAGAVGAQTYEKAGGTLAHIAIPPPPSGKAGG
jgi:rhodanese-related sulfurtransferase